MSDEQALPAITALANGPLLVSGGVRVVVKTPIESEHGEPMTWLKGDTLPAGERYALCRCGQSDRKPFCDGTHARVGFAPGDTPQVGPVKDYAGTGIEVHDDRKICVHAGFCGTRLTNVWKMVPQASDSTVRAQIIAMVERCPSGALSYSLPGVADDVEPDLPQEIAVIPDGPLWVSGGIPVSLSGGTTLPLRNRMTLCRCGASNNKPLCDGQHKEVGFRHTPSG